MKRTAAVLSATLLLGACSTGNDSSPDGNFHPESGVGVEQVYHGDGFSVYVMEAKWIPVDVLPEGRGRLQYEDGTVVRAGAHCIVNVVSEYDVYPQWSYVFVDNKGEEVIELPYRSSYVQYGNKEELASTHTYRIQPENSEFTCKVRAYR